MVLPSLLAPPGLPSALFLQNHSCCQSPETQKTGRKTSFGNSAWHYGSKRQAEKWSSLLWSVLLGWIPKKIRFRCLGDVGGHAGVWIFWQTLVQFDRWGFAELLKVWIRGQCCWEQSSRENKQSHGTTAHWAVQKQAHSLEFPVFGVVDRQDSPWCSFFQPVPSCQHHSPIPWPYIPHSSSSSSLLWSLCFWEFSWQVF